MTRLTWSWPGSDVGRLAVDQQPHVARAGEGDDVDVGVVDQRLADLLAQPGQEVQHARRQPGLVEDPDQVPGHHGRLLGRLEDHGVARDERRDGHAASGSPAGSSRGG